MKKNNIVIISILAVVVIALAVAVFYFINKSKQKDMELREVVEMMTFEKEQVEREFGNLATEYDGYTTTVRNDSLIKLLDVQKQKINQLLEELRVTKATNARRIAELKAELATVRTVMVQYVHQIDSLNIENTKLKTEKEVVTRKYTEAAQTVEQLSREKNNLTEVVTRASKLEIVDFSFRKLNSRGKKTTFFAQFVNLEISFTIGKNITAATGQKTVYLRLTRPDGEVLAKNPDNLFPFEDKRIAYSAKKDFEYEGENLEEVIYWKVEEIVQKGDYRADFFADGNRIGSFEFELKK